MACGCRKSRTLAASEAKVQRENGAVRGAEAAAVEIRPAMSRRQTLRAARAK